MADESWREEIITKGELVDMFLEANAKTTEVLEKFLSNYSSDYNMMKRLAELSHRIAIYPLELVVAKLKGKDNHVNRK